MDTRDLTYREKVRHLGNPYRGEGGVFTSPDEAVATRAIALPGGTQSRLREIGYTEEQIGALTEEGAHEVMKRHDRRGKEVAEPPPENLAGMTQAERNEYHRQHREREVWRAGGHPGRRKSDTQHPAQPKESTVDENARNLNALSLALYETGAAEHKGLLISLDLHPITAALLAVEDGEPIAEMHITLCYCGDVNEIGDIGIAQAILAMDQIARAAAPLNGKTGEVKYFPATPQSDGMMVQYASVEIPGLMQLRELVATMLDAIGVPPRRNFDYVPHITLRYVDPAIDTSTLKTPPAGVPLTFDNLSLSVGDKSTDMKFRGEAPLEVEPVVDDQHRPDLSAEAVNGAAARLALFPRVIDTDGRETVRAQDVFGQPMVKVQLASTLLNPKTTLSDVQMVTLGDLAPTQELIPVDGLSRYIGRPRNDPPDVLRLVSPSGERLVVQEGHTRAGAAILRGEQQIKARVWHLLLDAKGQYVGTIRGRHRQGNAKADAAATEYRDKVAGRMALSSDYRERLIELGNPHRGEGGRFGSEGDVGGTLPSGPNVSISRTEGNNELGFTPRAAKKATEVAAAIVRGLPKEWEARADVDGQLLTVDITSSDMDENAATVEIDFATAGHAYLHELVINEELYGQGHGTQIMRNAVEISQKVGAKGVQLQAGDKAGAYVWARMGFTADDPSTLASEVLKRLDSPDYDYAPETKAKIVQLVNDNDQNPRLPQLIADLRDGPKNIGSQLLTNGPGQMLDWYGTLSFKDTEAMDRFKKYAKK